MSSIASMSISQAERILAQKVAQTKAELIRDGWEIENPKPVSQASWDAFDALYMDLMNGKPVMVPQTTGRVVEYGIPLLPATLSLSGPKPYTVPVWGEYATEEDKPDPSHNCATNKDDSMECGLPSSNNLKMDEVDRFLEDVSIMRAIKKKDSNTAPLSNEMASRKSFDNQAVDNIANTIANKPSKRAAIIAKAKAEKQNPVASTQSANDKLSKLQRSKAKAKGRKPPTTRKAPVPEQELQVTSLQDPSGRTIYDLTNMSVSFLGRPQDLASASASLMSAIARMRDQPVEESGVVSGEPVSSDDTWEDAKSIASDASTIKLGGH